jgi:hypothetical protein
MNSEVEKRVRDIVTAAYGDPCDEWDTEAV